MAPKRTSSRANNPNIGPGLIVDGKYQLLRLLGEGGMGAVWAATHLGLHQTVALKIISGECADSPEARSRFDREAKAAARLKSRFVVQVFDNGELEDGTPYMAMELLEGEPLADRIDRGPIPPDEVLRYLDPIARALDRAHELGIVHRDIKPENIFLSRSHDDDGVTVKVLDFGIAKIAPVDGGHSQTQTGVLLGTPLFMSPEQARGLKSLDHRTDLYSVGIMVFTMLTMTNAFGGESIADLVVQVCTYPLPSFAERGVPLPAALDAWLHTACHRDPEKRFQSGRELCDAFAVAAGLRAPTPGGWLPEMDPARHASTLGGPGTNLAPGRSGTASLEGAARTQVDGLPRRSKAAVVAGSVLAVVAVLGALALVAARTATSRSSQIAVTPGPPAPAAGLSAPSSAEAPFPVASAPATDPNVSPSASASAAPTKPGGKPPTSGAHRTPASTGKSDGVEVGF